MRALLAAFLALGFVQVASAQTVLKREPHYLPPGAVVLVDSGRCGVGMVMKVTGVLKGASRRKVCVSLNPLEAKLGAIPAL